MNPPRPVSIRQVAKLAGVSVGTVSHVLNYPERVSARRRAAVHRAIEELGYVPNSAARQLKAGSSTTIAFLSSSMSHPFVSMFAYAIQVAAEKRNLMLVSASTFGDPQRSRRAIEMFERQRVRGIISIPARLDFTPEISAASHGTPVVLAAYDDPLRRLPCVASDNLAGGALVVNHLLEMGRRRILIVGPRGTPYYHERLRGAAIRCAELPGLSGGLIVTDGASVDDGAHAIDDYLARGRSDLPDAVLCSSDSLAFGVIGALFKHGLSVPGDVAVTGYDNTELCSSAIITLTSIDQSSVEMADAAIDLLEQARENPGPPHPARIFSPHLVARSSSQLP